MKWILFIIGGIVVLVILAAIGVFQEFFFFLFTTGIGALIGHFLGSSNVGAIIGAVLYFVWCLVRIIWPEKNTIINVVGNKTFSEEENSARNGWVGIIMLIVFVIVYFVSKSGVLD